MNTKEISLIKVKWRTAKNLFFVFLLVTPLKHLNNWGVDKWELPQVNFAYLNIISASLQPNPCSHLAGYSTHIYTHTNANANSLAAVTWSREPDIARMPVHMQAL